MGIDTLNKSDTTDSVTDSDAPGHHPGLSNGNQDVQMFASIKKNDRKVKLINLTFNSMRLNLKSKT